MTQLKKLDSRISHVLEGAVHSKHRSIIMLIGDEGKLQVVQLHQLLCAIRQQMNLTILWCMKKDLSFGGASKTKRLAKSRREVTQGKITSDTQESFEDFIKRTQTTYCKYDETERILGNTYDILILQDFESLSPNILARTVETVRGGGMVLLLLRTMTSLEQLYTLTMDVHARFRSETHPVVRPRFNRRFLLSFVDCPLFLCLDDALNVLPITDTLRTMKATKRVQSSLEGVGGGLLIQQEKDLNELRTRLASTPTASVLTKLAYTLDQAKVLLQLLKIFDTSVLSHTVALTAGRGRGKSAALGMAAAVALHYGFSRILVTSPSPENLRTFFSFVALTLKELGYVERQDFTVLQSTSAEWKNVTLRVDVHRKSHRQLVAYVSPEDHSNFAHAELLIVDEAAAIPLPTVQRMLGPYLVFLSSTVSGYEGTGRSLSLKLIQSLRSSGKTPLGLEGSTTTVGKNGRSLHEMSLTQPIRYGPNDPVEQWLYRVLCLDTKVAEPSFLPHPSQCALYHVNRDALFSYHTLAEALLQRIVSLLVHAHYKNQPNDLLLLADAPAHELFVLLDTHSVGQGMQTVQLPDVLCVLQVCYEGGLDVKTVERRIDEGSRPHGDLIPYTLSQSFLDASVAGRRGMRIVRIATHPSLQRAGYGKRAVHLLLDSFLATPRVTGSCSLPTEKKAHPHPNTSTDSSLALPTTGNGIQAEIASPPSTPPATLLQRLVSTEPSDGVSLYTHGADAHQPEYLGVSFGLTTDLFHFWCALGFRPVYVRQVTHENTGEFTMVMLRDVTADTTRASSDWIHSLSCEFHRRFLSLLGSSFRTLPLELSTLLALHGVPTQDARKMDSITETRAEPNTYYGDRHAVSLEPCRRDRIHVDGVPQLTTAELFGRYDFTTMDMERLVRYVSLRVDYSVIADLVPFLGRLYFQKKLYRYPYHSFATSASDDASSATTSAVGGVRLTATETAVLAAVALQEYYLTDLTSNHSNQASKEHATAGTQPRMGAGPFADFPLPQLRTFLHKSITAIVHHLQDLIRLDPPRSGESTVSASSPVGQPASERVYEYETHDPSSGKVVKKMRSESQVIHNKRLKRSALTHDLPN